MPSNKKHGLFSPSLMRKMKFQDLRLHSSLTLRSANKYFSGREHTNAVGSLNCLALFYFVHLWKWPDWKLYLNYEISSVCNLKAKTKNKHTNKPATPGKYVFFSTESGEAKTDDMVLIFLDKEPTLNESTRSIIFTITIYYYYLFYASEISQMPYKLCCV